jgi:hypothetical protein
MRRAATRPAASSPQYRRADTRVQRVRVPDGLLLAYVVERIDGNVEPGGGDDPSAVDGVLAVDVQRHQLVVELELRERQARGVTHGLERSKTRALEQLGGRVQLSGRRRAKETADTHVDRVYGAPADDLHQRARRHRAGAAGSDQRPARRSTPRGRSAVERSSS